MKKLLVINLFLAMFAVTGFAAEVETDPGADHCDTPKVEGKDTPTKPKPTSDKGKGQEGTNQ